MKHHYYFCRKFGFTLAEVLITLGIIGVVAALTIPSLIANYRKHVYYTQFRKAATVIENAIQRYNEENGCGDVTEDFIQEGNFTSFYTNNLCTYNEDGYAIDRLGSMFNVTKWITDDNYLEVCKGYDKIPPAINKHDGTDRNDWPNGADMLCNNDYGLEYNNGHGFITNDGMLINGPIDFGYGIGTALIDINGPDKGPNIFGRDIFQFYLYFSPGNRWGDYTSMNECNDSTKGTADCGSRLLIEGKMNY